MPSKIVEYLMKYVNYDIEYYDIGKDTDLKKFQQNLKKKLNETYEKCWSEESKPFNESKLFFCVSINVILCLSLILIISSSNIAKQCQS